MMKRILKSVSALAIASVTFAGTAMAQDVYSFGDSLSDTGNVSGVTFGLVPGGDYFAGRFSNGFVWTDYLSFRVSGELQDTNPGLIGRVFTSTSDGFNFAHGGAVAGNNGLNFGNILGGDLTGLLEGLSPFILTEQARHFRDDRVFFGRAYRASSNDIATISAGGNDYFNGETDPFFVVNSILSAIDIIEDNQINNFVVLDLPNVGDVPARFGTSSQAQLNALTAQHNSLLRQGADLIEAARGVNVSIVPVGLLFDIIVQDAQFNGGATFGFTNIAPGSGTSGNCLGDGLVGNACPTSFLFYDDIHPTARAHAIIGDLAYGTLLADSSASASFATRSVAVNQANVTQNRLISARLNAAQTGNIGTGFLSDGLRLGGNGISLAGNGLSFSSTDRGASANKAAHFYRYVDGAAPELFAFTPDAIGQSQAEATSLRLSAGEYISAYGADAYLGNGLFAGGLVSYTARQNSAFTTNRDDRSVNYAAYLAYFSGPLAVDFTTQSGTIDQNFTRATGFSFAPEVRGRTQSNYTVNRVNASYTLGEGPLKFGAHAKIATSNYQQDGYSEFGGLGLVDRSVEAINAQGTAGYVGGSISYGKGFGSKWAIGITANAGALATDSTQIGFGALIDTQDLLQEQFNQSAIFTPAITQDQFAGLFSSKLTLARGNRFAISAEGDALTSSEGMRHAVRLNLAWNF